MSDIFAPSQLLDEGAVHWAKHDLKMMALKQENLLAVLGSPDALLMCLARDSCMVVESSGWTHIVPY